MPCSVTFGVKRTDKMGRAKQYLETIFFNVCMCTFKHYLLIENPLTLMVSITSSGWCRADPI